jgi:hypothetical protein
VPNYGIIGAGIATTASYAVTAVAMTLAGRRFLPLTLPWGTMGRAVLAASIMYVALSLVRLATSAVIVVIVRVLLGVVIYAVVMGTIDADTRKLLRAAIRSISRSRHG